MTLSVRGASEDEPFVWSVTVTDVGNTQLFRVERDDSWLDAFFKDAGYVEDCNGYADCKRKWYFNDLPMKIAAALTISDNSTHAIEEWQREHLVQQAEGFLKAKGLGDRERRAVIDEMLKLREGVSDDLTVPLSVVQDDPSFMYVPSLGYFVPFWQS